MKNFVFGIMYFIFILIFVKVGYKLLVVAYATFAYLILLMVNILVKIITLPFVFIRWIILN